MDVCDERALPKESQLFVYCIYADGRLQAPVQTTKLTKLSKLKGGQEFEFGRVLHRHEKFSDDSLKVQSSKLKCRILENNPNLTA